MTERGFPTADPGRGRFRDYLKTVVRNAARKHLRRGARPNDAERLDGLAGPDPPDQSWDAEWRRCVVDRPPGPQSATSGDPGN